MRRIVDVYNHYVSNGRHYQFFAMGEMGARRVVCGSCAVLLPSGARFGSPHREVPVVHVTGTKGKSSTTWMSE